MLEVRDMNTQNSLERQCPLCRLQRRLLLLIGSAALALLPAALCAQHDTLAQARSLAAAGHLQQANELLSEAVQREPQDVALLQELGSVQLSQQLYDDAMNSFGSALLKPER
jgi:tetratricopeptide (TPR) repeat protein